MDKNLTAMNPFKNVPIFSIMDKGQLELIHKAAYQKTYPPDTFIFYEGDVADGLYVIVKGKVRIFLSDEKGREITLSVLGDGNFLGEMALFDAYPRSANAITLKETNFLILTKSYFLKQIEASPFMARGILKEMSLRLRDADEKIGSLALLDVAGRLARILINLARKEGMFLNKGNAAIIPKPIQQDLADMVGASRETVSRVLAMLQKDKFITITKKEILIHNIGDFQ